MALDVIDLEGEPNHLRAWERCLRYLPSLVVVESGQQWTSWLRREVHGLEIVIHRVDTLSPRTDTPAFPEVIAWQVDTENYAQILQSLSKYRCLNRKSLQVALVSDSSLTAGFCGLREAGAFNIQVGWYSSSLLNHILTRYWEIHANPPQAPLDEVIRLLPLRSR